MKKLLTVTCLAGLLSIPSVVFADEAVPEEVMSDEVMSDEAMAEEAMPEEPEISPEMQGHMGDSHSGPVWYGVIRVGISSTSGGDTGVSSFGSRFGVKGSSEVSEGLTAVYNYTQAIDASNATVQDGNRLSYVGLEGGFGSLKLGRVTSASYSTVGVINNKMYSRTGGGAGASVRVGNAVSYSLDVSGVKLQADVIMDSRPADIDQVEFGISVPVGDIGKIAFAHVRKEAYSEQVPLTIPTFSGESDAPGQTGTVRSITPFTAKNVEYVAPGFSLPITKTNVSEKKYTYKVAANSDGKTPEKVYKVLTRTVYEPVNATTGKSTLDPVINANDVASKLQKYTDYNLVGTKYYHQNCTDGDGKPGDPFTLKETVICTYISTQYFYNENELTDGATATNNKAVWNKDDKVYVSGKYTTETGVTTSSVEDPETELPTKISVKTTQDMETKRIKEHRSNHIAAEATLGAVKGYLGYSELELDGVKTDTTHFGISGGLGDSGLSYIVEVSKEEINTPWAIGVYKTLGGGAYTAFEHFTDGDTGTSSAFIAIDF